MRVLPCFPCWFVSLLFFVKFTWSRLSRSWKDTSLLRIDVHHSSPSSSQKTGTLIPVARERQSPKPIKNSRFSTGCPLSSPERLERLVRQGRSRRSRGPHQPQASAVRVPHPAAAHVGRVGAVGAYIHRREVPLADVDASTVKPHLAGFANHFSSQPRNNPR